MLPQFLFHFLLAALQLRLTVAVQWTIIEYRISLYTTSATTYSTDYYYTDDAYTYTGTTTIYLYPPVPTSLVPSASADDTSTSIYSYNNAVYKTLYYDASTIGSSLLSSIQDYDASSSLTSYSSSYTTTEFYVQKAFTAPASCPTPFTLSSLSSYYVPSGAITQVPTPTSYSTSRGALYTYVTAYLADDTDLPSTDTTTSADFYQTGYADQCDTPYSYSTYTSRPNYYSGGGSSSYDDDDTVCLGSLCPFWLIYIVVIIPVLGLLFLGGILESYFWFTRLMKGRFALRGVPILWVAISLWTLLCLRRKRPANQEHRPQLEKQWREMSTSTHISLWFKYGFRHRDPPELTRVIGAQAPSAPIWGAYSQQPQAYYTAPPGAPGAGPGTGTPMTHSSVYYQQPPQWQGTGPAPPGWVVYPAPGQQPTYGYMYPVPGQQPGQEQAKTMTTTTETTSHEGIVSTPSPAPVAPSSATEGTAVSSQTGDEGLPQVQQTHQNPGAPTTTNVQSSPEIRYQG